MLVSALLTSLAINSGLCVLFFTLYSILRKQPSNYEVYIPRLLAEGKSDKSGSFNLERLIPSPYWVKRAWQLTEDDLLSSSGLDAVVFMRLINFSLRVFMFAGVIGIFVLLPVNCSGNQLEYIDFTDLSNNSLDVFTISNVNNGSSKLWIHFAAVYLVTIFVCCLLYYIYVMLLVLMLLLPWKANYAREIRILLSLEFRYISQRRLDYFQSSKPQPHQFTILVRSIPVPSGSSVGEKVDSFFREYHPSTYLSHIVVRRTNKIKKLLNDTKKLYTRLLHLQSVPNQQKYTRSCCFGLFGRKVNLVEQYEKKLEDAEENVRLEQSEASLGGDEVRSAFVSFKSRYGAAIAHHLQQSTNPTNWVTEQAPEPRDVYWPFFSSSFIRRWISKLVVIFLCIVLTIVFLIPVVLVQGLTNLNQLEAWLPFLKNVLTITFVSQVITGYLPSLILLLFLKIVPPAMEFFSSIQGYVSLSDIQKSACSKVLWFTIWNIFFATVFSGSVLSKVYLFLDPKNIPSKLGLSVPAQSSFFIAYVVTSGWTSTSSELFRIIPLIWSLLKRPFTDSKDDEFEVPAMNYHNHMPRVLFFVLLGITYFFLAPLILPFLLVYLCLGFIIFRNQFINVYAPRFETAGKFWPIVHNSMIFSLVLMHAIAVGIFSIKNVNLASTLIFPLPVFTLLFNEYCRKRFLPNFVAYPAESLIRKDRQDENDPTMPEFLDKLVTVYQDPALMPINYSGSNDRLRSPLLSSAHQA